MQVLQLNSTFEAIAFISFKQAIKLIIKDKVDIIANWDKTVRFGSGSMPFPAIVRLKYYIPRHIKKFKYHKVGIFRRDKNTCQYCGYIGKGAEIDVDHIIPKSWGGKATWENIVTSCKICNSKKANKTPKMAGMKLLRKPVAPAIPIWFEYNAINPKHKDWEHYMVRC